jgi:quinol monooxygenase YgiN
MSTTPVTVIATLKARPGQEPALEQALLDLIPTTRKEAGCLNYDLHRSTDDSRVFVFYENWTSQAALEAHLANAHLVAFGQKADALLSEPPQIVLFQKIG